MSKSNYTKISNIIFDEYMHAMSSSAFKLVMYVARKTVGWNKEQDIISLTQFEAATGLSRKTLISAIKESLENGWIEQYVVKNTFAYALGYAFRGEPSQEYCDDFCTEKNLANGGKKNSISGNFPPKSVEKLHTQKTKETDTKDNQVVSSDSELPRSSRRGDAPAKACTLVEGKVYETTEAEVKRLLGTEAVLLWRSVYSRFIITKWLSKGKINVDVIIYSLAYALEKGQNPSIVFNMVKSAPDSLPAWSSAIDIDTGKPEWKRFIWNAFGDKPDSKFVDEAPFVF